MKALSIALCSSIGIMYNALDVPEEPPDPAPHPIVLDWEVNTLETEKDRLEDDIKSLKDEQKKAKEKADKLRQEVEKEEAKANERRSSKSGNGRTSVDSSNSSGSDDGVGGIKVESTFYTAKCDGCSGITRTGYDVRQTIYSPEGYRVIAVDPNVIPLESVVNVSLADGTSFKAKALDTGSDIQGGRIDVLVGTKDEAYSKGRQSATVEIIK